MNGLSHLEPPECSEFVEIDPSGRYGRYNEILGKGASKTVYRAFDEYEGIEVAWNQVKLYDFLQSSEDLERLYCEIHLLKTLKHKNIMKFYTSWVDTANRNINFVTEMFTYGTLRQYRLKHKRVNIRAVKQWCRQILRGLLYLHSHDPPVIHRDLKCDNIFVNGNQGEVKIGDLGLAAILRKSHAAHCVGTPEFMAPEVYEEAYNELVDIYSFGMCILEMVTFEYPYSECTHPAQIYKKVISGKKPDALQSEGSRKPEIEVHGLGPMMRLLSLEPHENTNSYSNVYLNGHGYETQNEWEYQLVEVEPSGIELFEHHDEHPANVDISIKGKRGDDGGIFLRIRIADEEGRIRNIYFPFDIETDTALSVATEMVAELDINDQDVTKIADMIDGEIAGLVPEWKPGPGIEDTPRFANQAVCHNCASTCTSNEGAPNILSQPEYSHYQEVWDQQESRQLVPMGSGRSHLDEQYDSFDQPIPEKNTKEKRMENGIPDGGKSFRHLTGSGSFSRPTSLYNDLADSNESEIQQDLRWLKAKHQMELRKLRDEQLGLAVKPSPSTSRNGEGITSNQVSSSSMSNSSQEDSNGDVSKSLTKQASHNMHAHASNSCALSDTQRHRNHKVMKLSPRPEDMLLPRISAPGHCFHTRFTGQLPYQLMLLININVLPRCHSPAHRTGTNKLYNELRCKIDKCRVVERPFTSSIWPGQWQLPNNEMGFMIS
ncbi:hypothetical protein OIU76_023173 [Salix suchowensis]|nr:hypothetical protein OIU76_023173 [Salix suchowensis]